MKTSFARGQRGFSLLEVTIATALMAGALVSLAQMVSVAVANNVAARAISYTTVLAADRMAELQELAWPPGAPPPAPSPPGTLTANVDGWVDYVDRDGASLGGGTIPPAGTVYVRRWAVEPLPIRPDSAVVVQVRVLRLSARDRVETHGTVVSRPDEARVVAVKRRPAR